jgi:nucleoside diphosphate-linked moiety X motif protein 19
MAKSWRDAASLIVLARDVSKKSKFDYKVNARSVDFSLKVQRFINFVFKNKSYFKVLAFKRTEKTSFYANSLAFPGGSIDDSDELSNWMNFFTHHKMPLESFKRNVSVKKPFIYDKRNGKIDRELSLRINAIRETFEELGIVLCSPRNEILRSSSFSSYFHSKNCDIPLWQHKIHNNHESLMQFCDHFNLVPNIYTIFEWSVWLTPTFYPKRFETAFFLVTLNNIPPCYAESNEVQDYSVKLHLRLINKILIS